MLRKCLVGLVSLLVSISVLADIDLSTSINDVFHEGTNELTGSITFKVTGDDFKNIGTDNPAFIRLRLNNNAVLAGTLVNIPAVTATNGETFDYLYLAARMENTTFSVAAGMEEAIRIARWVEGEDEIWIEVRRPTNAWVDNGVGGTLAPQPEFPVAFTIGVSARQTDSSNEDGGSSSLPFNTKDTTAVEGEYDEAWSTLICVDFYNDESGNLEVAELFEFDAIAYDQTAETDGRDTGVLTEGAIFNVNFSDDRVIARGRDRSCTVSVLGGKGVGSAEEKLCIDSAPENSSTSGWVQMDNTICFRIRCLRGSEFLDTRLFTGAYFNFTTDGGNYGFESGNDLFFTGGFPGATFLDSSSSFSSHGETLYRSADVEWGGNASGDEESLSSGYDVCITANMWYWFEEDPTDVVLTWSLYLTNNGGEIGIGVHDIEPFEEDHQIVDCPPSFFFVDSGDWEFGSFVSCSSDLVSIFFPFIPRVMTEEGASTGFWAGLSLVNQGDHDWADGELTASIYDENGNHFATSLPALAVRQQANFVFWASDGTAAIFGQGGPATEDAFIPLPTDDDVSADMFGRWKMSMFVWGQYPVTFLDELSLGDLDGYLLIGSGAAGDGGLMINGAYLPRNHDRHDAVDQDSDMPIQRTKN